MRSRMYIDLCDNVTIDAAIQHAALWPFQRDCQHHTPCPTGYCDWHEWGDMMDRAGYSQVTCSVCGGFWIWLPKKIAAAIRRQDAKEQRKMLAALRAERQKGGA